MSIKKRIIGVLNYRKPAMWVCIALMVAVVGVGMFFFTDPVEYPPYYMELMESLAKPLDEVCENLDIKQDDLFENGVGNYSTPIHVEYAGVTFQLHLHTNFDADCETLGYFSYTAVFDGSTDEADKAAAAVAHRLYKTYGAGENALLSSRPDLFKDISPEEVAAAFSDISNTGTPGRIFDHWDISDSGHGNLDALLDALQAEYYQNNNGTGARVCYLVRYLATRDIERNTKTISIVYRNYMNFISWESGQGVTYAIKLDPLKE